MISTGKSLRLVAVASRAGAAAGAHASSCCGRRTTTSTPSSFFSVGSSPMLRPSRSSSFLSSSSSHRRSFASAVEQDDPSDDNSAGADATAATTTTGEAEGAAAPPSELERNLRPSQVVAELDRHIVGQHDAKRAVAIAMRNRWRRKQLPDDLRKEVTPRNVLLVGPTGCGKTEVARRMANLNDAPFIKVEGTRENIMRFVLFYPSEISVTSCCCMYISSLVVFSNRFPMALFIFIN